MQKLVHHRQPKSPRSVSAPSGSPSSRCVQFDHAPHRRSPNTFPFISIIILNCISFVILLIPGTASPHYRNITHMLREMAGYPVHQQLLTSIAPPSII